MTVTHYYGRTCYTKPTLKSFPFKNRVFPIAYLWIFWFCSWECRLCPAELLGWSWQCNRHGQQWIRYKWMCRESGRRLSIDEEACLAVVEHHPSTGIYPEEVTRVTLLRFAVTALSTFPSENRQHAVARLEISHTLTHTLHNSDYTNKKLWYKKE